ncbi:hypothetical protein BDW72DRAFT_167147 [Aspergillus terricola var. indicus]
MLCHIMPIRVLADNLIWWLKRSPQMGRAKWGFDCYIWSAVVLAAGVVSGGWKHRRLSGLLRVLYAGVLCLCPGKVSYAE